MDNSTLEEQLRTELRAVVQNLSPPVDLDEALDRARRRARRRRRASALAVPVIAAVALATVLSLSRGVTDVVTRNDEVPEVRQTAPAPVSGRTGHTATWTGEDVIIWGGASDHVLGDGAAYRPATDRWSMLPPAPISPRTGHSAVWTGSELLIWGGHASLDSEESVLADGAAYEAARGRWRIIPPAPMGGLVTQQAIWTGEAMVVVGTAPGAPSGIRGASFDPATDRWQSLPDLDVARPIHDLRLVWTGRRFVGVFFPVSAPRVIVARYEGSRWETSTPFEVDPAFVTDAAWVAPRLFLFSSISTAPGGEPISTVAVNLETGRHESLPPPPADLTNVDRAVVADELVVFGGQQFDARSDEWSTNGLPDDGSEFRVGVAASTEIVFWGGRSCPPAATCLDFDGPRRGVRLALQEG
jgi:hypothetical protein